MTPDIEPDRADQQASEKRQPPGPGVQRFDRKDARDDHAGERPEQDRQTLPDHLQRTVDSTPTGGRDFDQKCGRTCEFSAGRKALQQSADHDEHGGEEADRRIGRGEGDDGDGRGHHEHDELQRRLSSFPIRVKSEEEAAERARAEARAKGRERQQERGRLVSAWKERLRQNRSKKAVDDEIIPFQRIPNHGGRDLFGRWRSHLGEVLAHMHANFSIVRARGVFAFGEQATAAKRFPIT